MRTRRLFDGSRHQEKRNVSSNKMLVIVERQIGINTCSDKNWINNEEYNPSAVYQN